MKKIILLSVIVLLVGISGSAFAGGGTYGFLTDSLTLGTAGDPLPQLVVKLSKNVAMQIQISASTAPDPTVNYVMGAYHTTGSRTFGTSNQDQKLYYHETTGVAIPTVSTSTTVLPDWAASGYLPL